MGNGYCFRANLFPIVFYKMEANQVVDHLFFINYQLTLGDIDEYFEKMGFLNTVREKSVLSYIDNCSSNSDGISWYIINLAEGKVLNSSFRTSKEINLDALQDYAQMKYNFSYEQENDNVIIYKKNNLQLHFRTSSFETFEFSKRMHQITLFEPLSKQVEVTLMPPTI
jgi:hypothetical protein